MPDMKLRASALKDCPRKTVAEPAGAYVRDWTPVERRRMFRGRVAEKGYLDWLQDEHPDWTIIRQKEIPWRFGVGHADAYAVEPSLLFEILSSSNPGGQLVDAKLRQLVLYLMHFDAAESGVLVIIDADSEEQRIPVRRGTPRYNEFVQEIEERIRQVALWDGGNGPLPPRVCRKPTDAIGHFCRAGQWCFQGWEPPDTPEIDQDGSRAAAAAWYQAKREEESAVAVSKAATMERKRREEKLAEYVPEGKWRVGPLEITRTRVQRGPTADLKRLELAGINIPAELLKAGAAYDTFRVERVSDEPLTTPDDYGEVPY